MVTTFDAVPNRALDLLFVIDDSGSMAEEQDALVAALPDYLHAVVQRAGGMPDLHVAVVTTDLGTENGRSLPGTGGCVGEGDHGGFQTGGLVLAGGSTFLSDVDAGDGVTRIRNFDGDLATAFAQMATLGTGGCGFEQPLEAMRRALDGSNPGNAGFLRPDAALGVVIISDEDDCSVSDNAFFADDPEGVAGPLGPLASFRCTEFGIVCDDDDDPRAPGPRSHCRPRTNSPYLTNIDDYVDFLHALKPGRPDRVFVDGIIGPPAPVEITLAQPPDGGQPAPQLAPSCTYTAIDGQGDWPQTAYPGVRLSALFAAVNADPAPPAQLCGAVQPYMDPFAVRSAVALGSPCLPTLLVAEPGVADWQPRCTVEEIVDLGGATEHRTAVPSCRADGGGTCWRVQADALRCQDAAGGLEFVVDRSAAPAARTTYRATCAR